MPGGTVAPGDVVERCDVALSDVGGIGQLKRELVATNARLDDVYRELHSLNSEQMRAVVAELREIRALLTAAAGDAS